MKTKTLISRLMKDESAASAIEYGLIIGGISMVIIVALQGLSGGLGAIWNTVSTQTTAAIGTPS